MERYMDTNLSPKERAQELLKKMDLPEKMAQVVGVFAMRGTENELREFLPNGVGQISTLFFREEKNHREAAAWQRELQTLMMENSPNHIPVAFHMEGICGAYVEGSTIFPSGVSRGAGFDPELEEKIGSIVARQELAYGITQTFAPVLDISRDSRMGRQAESYGEDPTLAAVLGTAYTKGLQGAEIDGRRADAVAKHFLGFHLSQGGIHGANADAGDRLLEEVYAKPFQAAIRDGKLHGVMPCYDSLNGQPIHASRHYLNDLLREKMGFDGVVVSDYSGVENAFKVSMVGETQGETGLMCLRAGTDVELPMPSCYGEEMAMAFATGKADIALLDRAVLRILEAKFRMGLFENPFAMEGEELEKTAHCEEDEIVARQAAQQSIVLLKNNGVLPFSGKEKTIAVIGPHAANARFYFGGYTHVSMLEETRASAWSMAGTGSVENRCEEMKRVPGTSVEEDEGERFDEVLQHLKPECHNLVQALRSELPDAEILTAKGYHKAGADESLFDEALELVRRADFVILTLGGKNGTGSIATMGEGVDSTDINLPPCQDAFIREAAKFGKPMVGVHFDGRPVSSDTADELLDAIIEAWMPATFGAEAVANVLTGRYNPSGKMPLTVARNAGQIPIYYNHPNGSAWHQARSIGFQDYVDQPHLPRYCYGHGLSYTNFAYSDIRIDQKEVGPQEKVAIRAKIKNTGTVAGTEIVQLYLRDLHASMTRPVKEMQGFLRVELKPGEEKTLCFTVQPSQMAFLDEDMRWKIEKGEFAVQLGSSSEDIRLEDSFTVTENSWIDGRDRGFCASAEILE